MQQRFKAGQGDAADALHFLLHGEASVVLPLQQGGVKRLQTLSAIMNFCEATLMAGGQLNADVRADMPVVFLLQLPMSALHRSRTKSLGSLRA